MHAGSLSCLTGTLEQNRDTDCAFVGALTSQDGCNEKALTSETMFAVGSLNYITYTNK